MKTVGFRSVVLYLLLAAFLAGLGYFGVELLLHGDQWAMQPYNGHLYAGDSPVSLGTVKDRDGNILAQTGDGSRLYSEDGTVRRALLHTVGDPNGMISTSVEYTMRGKLTGYNLVTGLNNTVFNQFTKNITLTVDQDVCAAAYDALNGHDGAVIVYNYRNGEILCKVSAPGFDPMDVPEDIETNDAYRGAYLDKTLSGSFAPGSIFKLVTAAAAMERWPETWSGKTYDCQGYVEIGNNDITCLHGEAHGVQDMYGAMGNSCNVYFAQLAVELGAAALQKKAEEMGFNRALSFGGTEVSQSTAKLSGANDNELGWAGVGQYTVLANPYHMMALMGAVAGGGAYAEPKLTDSVDLLGGLSGGSRELLTAEEAKNLKSLLRSNVEEYYGDWMFPEGMNVCAKTGTGEVGNDRGPNCWMIGFCDSAAYPYAFAVLVEDGAGGMESAGNLAAAVLSALY